MENSSENLRTSILRAHNQSITDPPSCNSCIPIAEASYFTNQAFGSKAKWTLLSLSTVAFLVNLTLALSIITSRLLRKRVTYIFVVSLTTSQLIITSSVIPMYSFIPDHPVNGYLTALAVVSYITNLSAVTYDRFVAITQSFYYHERVTKTRARMTINMCWLASFAVQIVPVLWDNKNVLAHRIYLISLVLVFLLLPLVCISTMSTKIIVEMTKMLRRDKLRRRANRPATERESANSSRVLSKNSNKQTAPCLARRARRPTKRGTGKMQSEMQLAGVCLTLIFVYGVTWTPVLYMTALKAFDRTDLEPPHFSQIALYLLVLSAIIDPVLYGLGVKEVRKSIYKMLSGRITR